MFEYQGSIEIQGYRNVDQPNVSAPGIVYFMELNNWHQSEDKEDRYHDICNTLNIIFHTLQNS